MRCGKKQKKTTNSVINITKIKFLRIMKTRVFLVAALVALGFAACNNDDVPHFEKEGAPATVTVKLFTEGSSTRTRNVVNATNVAYESEIHSLQVFLFRGQQMETNHFFNRVDLEETDDGFVAEGIDATSGIRTLFVIANHPELGWNYTLTEFRNLNTNVLNQNIATTGLVMTSVERDITLVEGENLLGNPEGTHHETHTHGVDFNHINVGDPTLELDDNLLLHRINARIALTNVTVRFDDPRFDRFELVEVAMFNVRNTSRLFTRPTTFERVNNEVNNAFFSFGSPFPTPLNSFRQVGATTAPSLLVNLPGQIVPLDIAGLNDGRHIFFYAFENVGDPLVEVDDEYVRVNRDGTFIVLKGRLMKGTEQFRFDGVFTCDAGYTYYAIWVNDAHRSTFTTPLGTPPMGDNTIHRNTQYNISVTLWGPGNPSIDPVEEAFLDVHVEVAPWIVVNQNVNWGTPRP